MQKHGWGVNKSRRMKTVGKSFANVPQGTAGTLALRTPAWGHQFLPGPGCRQLRGMSLHIVPSCPAGVSFTVPTPSSLEPAGFELPTHIKGHKFGLGLHKFDSINISFRRV